ncbi:S1/P1 nuclease [Xanthomonas oryzae pv. oryzae]|nr:S1/P1 nuclease [Xanthomonas oryzae]MDI9072040.1 S1/P1 nuclease [Xanthomonas oryzae pv. oryzae]MDI9078355.1 S1/P1 nuclease [Xanthomonas oryzae pv. oryzae]MDI9104328.1 S1/P1 nuclease [Xanthomonas oryzae pv. oryzae]MDI9909826.1 S1/P1 nuclease [Xanthomonas oryzae pv. oryzae]URQ81565.1 S1/P1 nuclease [Xanthomonas oryzae pv. oryzae]
MLRRGCRISGTAIKPSRADAYNRGMKTFPLPAFVIATAMAAALQPTTALAWGPQGHRLVARIAETELSPQARAQVAQLLAGERDPTLHGVATWADELREHDPDLGKRSGPWHYVNLGEHDCAYSPPRDCPDGNCVIAALDQQTALLADRTQPLDVRRQALKFVVHFVGDIHQPMHAGYAHDKGGNDFQLQIDGKGSNLHSLWDSGMLNDSHLSDDAYLQRLLALPTAATMSAVLPPPAAAWAQASCKIAITPDVYPSAHVLPSTYIATYRPIAETQLRIAGDRLAAILNATLASP